jgi:hypothetical protein
MKRKDQVKMSIPHIPVLRRGKPYESLQTAEVRDSRTGEVLAVIGQANAGLIRRDLRSIEESFQILRSVPVSDLLGISLKAGDLFMNGVLPLGSGGETQSPQQYVETLSRTSGLPHTLCRKNMVKIHQVFTEMATILRGLTRGLDLTALDRGFGEQAGLPVSFFPVANSLGAVLPSNSPGVNSLWIPSVVMKVPVVLKPGREEPWTPLRIMQAFMAAGMPPEAFSYYPTDHEGAATILNNCGRSLLFGDSSTTAPYAHNPAIQLHGPGWSKVLIGADAAEHWEDFVDVLVDSIVANGGRSCINASAIVTHSHAHEIAETVGERLASITAKAADDPSAELSAFANVKMAEWIDETLTEGLKSPGAREVTAQHRQGPRRVEVEGATYLLPTLVHCDSFDHPLANKEFLFPYASVVEIPQDKMLDTIGPSLVVTVLTEDQTFIDRILRCQQIDRLNLGPIPTSKVEWDQPHEGNLFEFLYHRRAIQRAV